MCKTKIIVDDAQEEIVKRSRCVPRLAVASIIGLRSMYPGQQITQEKALSYFNAIGLDDQGLNELNRKTLRVMKEKFPVTPVGLHTLASVLGENPDTMMAEEGFLLKKGLILLTPQGRTLTNAGRDYQ